MDVQRSVTDEQAEQIGRRAAALGRDRGVKAECFNADLVRDCLKRSYMAYDEWPEKEDLE